MSSQEKPVDFFIRQATNEDISGIKNVVFTILREYGLPPDEKGKDKDLENVEKEYSAPHGFFGVLVEIKTNNIIGTIGLCRIDAQTSELRKMYLQKDHRGKGLGKYLLTTALAVAKQRQVKRIFLETISPLQEAISLYRQFGFTEIPISVKNERVDRAFELYLED